MSVTVIFLKLDIRKYVDCPENHKNCLLTQDKYVNETELKELVLKTDFHLNFTYKLSSYHKENIFHNNKIIKSIQMMVLYEQLAFILDIAQNTQTQSVQNSPLLLQ